MPFSNAPDSPHVIPANSQSECSDFGYGPITAETGLVTSGEIENLPLEETFVIHLPFVKDRKT